MRKIMVIDDSREFLTLMQAWLESEQFEVCSCADARNAAEVAAAERPNLILLDLAMPDKTGVEVLSELKLRCTTRRIPVLVLTAVPKPPEEDDVLIRKLAEESVPKPFDFEQLLLRLRHYLDRQRDACMAR